MKVEWGDQPLLVRAEGVGCGGRGAQERVRHEEVEEGEVQVGRRRVEGLDHAVVGGEYEDGGGEERGELTKKPLRLDVDVRGATSAGSKGQPTRVWRAHAEGSC